MTNEFDQGDYVLVPKSKAKISRARKGLIGFMVVGAIAAIAGAGTFASFSASTTNDASFQTGIMRLSNTVGSGTVCFSDETDVDFNEGTCDSLFKTNIVAGEEVNKVVTIKNEGTSAGKLVLFGEDVDPVGTAACYDAAATTTGFDEVQKLTVTATGGTYTLSYDGGTPSADIPFNETAANLDTLIEGLITGDDDDVTVTGNNTAGYVITFTGGDLAKTQVPQLVVNPASATGGTVTIATSQEGLGATVGAGTKVNELCETVHATIQEVTNAGGTTPLGTTCVLPTNVSAVCAAIDDAGNNGTLATIPLFTGTPLSLDVTFEPAETRYYKITMKLPKATTGDMGPGGICDVNGFDTDDGTGCDNWYMNGKAAVGLRWQLQL